MNVNVESILTVCCACPAPNEDIVCNFKRRERKKRKIDALQ